MNSEQWKEFQPLIARVLDISEDQRIPYLNRVFREDSVFQNNPELQDEIRQIVLLEGQRHRFKAFASENILAFQKDQNTDDKEIGPYKVIKKIGQGGMGVVYLAIRNDGEYRKQVAIKVIKEGSYGGNVLQRFFKERQITAGLNHENVAKLYDGGTTKEGVPYFVLEYIEGLPIDQYCDKSRLTVTERLKLFCAICEAVQHAHQNLIVHRDIKPSNILVTKNGKPKLLDFGIAKFLNSDLYAQGYDPTATTMKLMTPEYASPEQVLGEPVTVASDVYSLGVLLYELLTGHRPYHLKTQRIDEIIRVVCQEPPPFPSTIVIRTEEVPELDKQKKILITPQSVSKTRQVTPYKLQRLLSGDLDKIVLKSLRKEPSERYQSVEAFSEDIKRYLNKLPVLARKGDLSYRLIKSFQRNRVSFFSSFFIFSILVGGIVTTTWQARRAQRRFDEAHQVVSAFFQLDTKIAGITGTTEARNFIVSEGLKYLNSLSEEAGTDWSLKNELAIGYAKVGYIQWNRYYANLGDRNGSLRNYQKALEIRELHFSEYPADNYNKYHLLHIYLEGMGDLSVASKDPKNGMMYYKKALSLAESLVAAEAANKDWLDVLALCYERIGDTSGNPQYPNLGNHTIALEYHQKALATREVILALHPLDEIDCLHKIGISYEKIGDLHRASNDLSRAMEWYSKELVAFERSSKARPENYRYRQDLGSIYGKLGDTLRKMGNNLKALEMYSDSLKIREELFAGDPANVKNRDYLITLSEIMVQTFLAVPQITPNQMKEVEKLTALSLSIRKEQADHPAASVESLNGYAWALLTCNPKKMRNPEIALSYAKQAVQKSNEQDANTLDTLAWAYFYTNQRVQAIETEKKASALVENQSSQFKEFNQNIEKFKVSIDK